MDVYRKEKVDFLKAQFVSDEVEYEYRKKYLKRDKLQALILICIGYILTLIFIKTDFNLFGDTEVIYSLMLIRVTIFLVTLVTVGCLIKVENIKAIDTISIFWVLSYALCALFINATRTDPAHYHIIVDATFLIAIYLFFPTSFYYQFIPAIFFSLISIYCLLYVNPANSMMLYNIAIFTFVCINVGGAYWSWNFHTSRRVHYASLINESRIKEQLEKALDEVKTLQGIIPICSFCKNVRSDEGYWKKVEEYVGEHSNVKFSHSVCPECAKQHYGLDIKSK